MERLARSGSVGPGRRASDAEAAAEIGATARARGKRRAEKVHGDVRVSVRA